MIEKWLTKSTLERALAELRASDIHPHTLVFLAMKQCGVNDSSPVKFESAHDMRDAFFRKYFKVGEYEQEGKKDQYYRIFDGSLTPKTNSVYPHSSLYSPWKATREEYIRNAVEWEPDNDYMVRFKVGYCDVLAAKFIKSKKIPLCALAVYLQAIEGCVPSNLTLKELVEKWAEL